MNIDDDEWGNLGDFDATDTRENVRAANRAKAKDLNWREKQLKGIQSEEARKKISEGNKRFYSTPNGKKISKKIAQKNKLNPEWQKNVKKSFKKLHNDPQFQIEHKERNVSKWKNFRNSDKYWEAHQKAIEATQVAVVTPIGEFTSQAKYKSVSGFSFHDKKRSYPHLYYEKDKGPGKPKYENLITTIYGVFYTAQDSHNAAIQANDKNATMTNDPFGYLKKMMRKEPNLYYKEKVKKTDRNLYNK